MKIRTYNGSNPGDFFILSKGKNSGRPGTTPNHPGNCFSVFAEKNEDPAELFALVEVHYAAGSFRPYLVGSVIEFLRLDDVRKVLFGVRQPTSEALQSIKEVLIDTRKKEVEAARFFARRRRLIKQLAQSSIREGGRR